MPKRFAVLVQDLNADEARLLINEIDDGSFFDYSKERLAEKEQPAKFVPAAPVTNIVNNAPPAPVAAQADAVKRDTSGLPWDERIHSGGDKNVNKDGTWKKRKGIQQITVDEVTAELRAANPATAAAPMATPPMPYVPPVAPPMPTTFTPPAPVATAPARAPIEQMVAPPAPVERDFQGLMVHISKLFQEKRIAPDYPNTVIARINSGYQVQLAAITDVANDPRFVQYAWSCLDIDGVGK